MIRWFVIILLAFVVYKMLQNKTEDSWWRNIV
jgi:hypothetical protein